MPKDDSLVRGVLAVMGKPKAEEADDVSDVSEAEEALAEDLLAASDANDPKALARALKSFIEVCGSGSEYGGEE